MKLHPFYTAATHLREFWGIVLPDDEFETIGMHAWEKINNKITMLYKYTGVVLNGELELPPNVDIIESVHACGEDYNKAINLGAEGNNNVENQIEGAIYKNTNPLYTSGRLVSYEVGDGVLYFKEDGISVTVIYKGIVLDDEGLPSINFKEMEAIANYCAFVTTRKKGMISRDQGAIQLAQMLQIEWQRTCDDARNPLSLSQNDMNEILDVKSNWDRKRYNHSYKPLR